MFIVKYIAILIGFYQVIQSGQLSSFLYNNIWISAINLLIELLVNLYVAIENPALIIVMEIINNPYIRDGMNFIVQFVHTIIHNVNRYCSWWFNKAEK
jgi:hypothetical protein